MILYFDYSDFRKGVADIFVDSDQLFIETITLQMIVCHHTAYAVFGEAGGVDAQSPQQFQDGGIDIAVALQLDNHQVAGLGILIGLIVVETDIKINGEALGLAHIHEGDALEAVLYRGIDIVHRLACELLCKLAAACFLDDVTVVIGYCYALFLRPPMIILGLHFQEREVAVQIGANTNLLARSTAIMMFQIKAVAGRVPIHGTIIGDSRAVDLLRIVITLRQLQQRRQLLFVRHKLRIGTVHELDTAHLIE